jgi:predicted enzyme related to lactoylglutathione lyase
MAPTGDQRAPAWFDISSLDAPRARRFYHAMFGWPMNVVEDQGYTLVGGEGGEPMGGIGQTGPGSPYAGSDQPARYGTDGGVHRSRRQPRRSAGPLTYARGARPGKEEDRRRPGLAILTGPGAAGRRGG